MAQRQAATPGYPSPPPPNFAQTSQPSRGWFGRNWGWVLGCGCLSVILAGAGLFVLLFVVALSALKDHPVCRQAMQQAQNSPEACELLGAPIESGYFVSGSVGAQNNTGNAELEIPVSGPKGSGTLKVQATLASGTWNITSLELHVDGRAAPLVIVGPTGEARTDRAEAPAGRPASIEAGLHAQAAAMAKCFRNLAAQDFNELLEMAATPECRKAWLDSSAGLFAEQGEAALFFTTAFFMVPESQRDSFTVAAYNVWIDSAIVAKYEKTGGEPKIREMKAVSIGAPETIVTLNAAALEKELQRRIAGAAGADLAKATHSTQNALAIRKTLSGYLASLRECFSAQCKPENTALREAVERLLVECSKQKPANWPSEVGGIGLLSELPPEWRSTMQPVYIAKGTDGHLAAFSSAAAPGRWLFMELAAEGQTVKVKKVSIGTAATSSKGKKK